VDIANMGGLAVLFYEMLNEKKVADTTIKSIDASSEPMNSIIW
jgi:hypothetical protein